MTLTDLLVPTFTQMLRALSSWLEKASGQAEARGEAADSLLFLRLAPDMYPLGAQVRFSCFQAQEPLYRLRGQCLPESLEHVRSGAWKGDGEAEIIADARTWIADALAVLEKLEAGALDDGADRPISLELPNGMAFDMTGAQYARDWSLPQFYFHVSIAYAILRNHAVELGKADLVPHMYAYMRPGPAQA